MSGTTDRIFIHGFITCCMHVFLPTSHLAAMRATMIHRLKFKMASNMHFNVKQHFDLIQTVANPVSFGPFFL